MFFLTSGGELNPIACSSMLSFLMTSTHQILINQSGGQTPALPEDKVSNLYTVYRVFLRPTVERLSGGSLPAFDDLLVEFAAVLPNSKSDAPMLSSESLEK